VSLEIEVLERFFQATQGVLVERDVVVGHHEHNKTQRGESVIRHLADSIARQVEQRQHDHDDELAYRVSYTTNLSISHFIL